MKDTGRMLALEAPNEGYRLIQSLVEDIPVPGS